MSMTTTEEGPLQETGLETIISWAQLKEEETHGTTPVPVTVVYIKLISILILYYFSPVHSEGHYYISHI